MYADPDRYHDDKMAEFDHLPTIRFSHLRAFGRSAAHGQHALQVEQEQTYAMERGTAVHALLFGTRKVIGYDKPRRGKEYDAFAADHPEHEILTAAEYKKAQEMALAVSRCPAAGPLLTGEVEQTIRFRWQNLDCRATPDVRGKNFLTELKTSKTSDPSKFLWHARRMHYHAQLRFQQIASEQPILVQTRREISDHYIICVESEAPYPVTIFHVEPEALLEGQQLLTLWAERLKNAASTEHYPAYTDAIVPLVWPKDDVIEFGDEE